MSTNNDNHFDLIVLGGGTGGYTAAFRARQLGLRVALVEQAKIGGTCLHVGCVPTKALLESAGLFGRLRRAGEFGIVLHDQPGLDYDQIARRRDEVVKRMWTGLTGLVTRNGVEFVSGRGRLDGPLTVRVALNGEDGVASTGGERVLQADNVILATGSRVKNLPGLVPDGERIVTSDDVTTKSHLPKTVIVVGGGAVGSEFASMYADLGTDVTLLEYLPSIVPLEDHELGRELERAFVRRGIRVVTKARFDPSAVTVTADGVSLMVGPEGEPAQELRAEQLLVATGRAANVEALGLETTRVEVERGLVKVDRRLQTGEPHVWAIGDLIGGLQLAHVAAHEGMIAVHNLAGRGVPEEIDYDLQPRATFSRPQVASVGLTEEQCQASGIAVKIGRFPFAAAAKAIIVGEPEGFAKVIADAKTDEILGIHLIGPDVTDLIAEGAVAMNLEATAAELGASTHPHPTLVEVIGEAAMAVSGGQINA
jgi:dihydrolipoamide dehydrogenase